MMESLFSGVDPDYSGIELPHLTPFKTGTGWGIQWVSRAPVEKHHKKGPYKIHSFHLLRFHEIKFSSLAHNLPGSLG